MGYLSESFDAAKEGRFGCEPAEFEAPDPRRTPLPQPHQAPAHRRGVDHQEEEEPGHPLGGPRAPEALGSGHPEGHGGVETAEDAGDPRSQRTVEGEIGSSREGGMERGENQL